MTTVVRDDLSAFLPSFGLSSFRPGQREVMETVLAGNDCLCVMPTGGGKSLCYQLPAIAQPGLTLVVSPLIALMKDQTDQLAARKLPATFINSMLTPDQQYDRLARMADGEFKLVYVVPERFRSGRFVDAVRRCDLKLLAIDEAHCVSEWGHDFRPDYARLGHFRSILGNPPTIALTATATDVVRRDIVELLKLREPEVFITGFARPNLFYSVQICSADRDKDQALVRFLAQNPGSGIVYASTRKRCEDLAERIAAATKRTTTVYHAGLQPEDRKAAQEDFMQGRAEIAVATLAFGMGIDKADVRFVVHYNLPGSLEAYYQEAGRAGRDGLPAQCLLLVGGGDRQIHEFFIESAYPAREVVQEVYEYLSQLDQDPIELTRQEIKETLGLQISEDGIGACEKLLEGAGVLERLESGENAAAIRLNSDLPTLVDLLPQQAKVKRQVLRAVEQLVGENRREWCYIQPREILRQLPEFDSASLTRHLRELAELASVDYVPPFRGRAIHMLARDRAFCELDLDFAALDRQKAAEYERLENVVRFGRSFNCRQQVILSYFGEANSAACGHCDNCQPPAGGKWGIQAPATPEILHVVRVVLSGVARVRRGCGKQLLAQMLCGARNQKVTRNRMDKLSTFGLLGHLAQTEVVKITEALLQAKLLEESEIEPFRPVLQLTARGAEVMSGRDSSQLMLDLPDSLRKKLSPTSGPINNGLLTASASPTSGDGGGKGSSASPPDPVLLARLREWRNFNARSRSVKPFQIMSNATLTEVAQALPDSIEALSSVRGVGPITVREHGQAILQLLAAHASAGCSLHGENTAPVPVNIRPALPSTTREEEVAVNAAAGVSRPIRGISTAIEPNPSASPSETKPSQPSYYWTWRLLTAGFTPDECACARSLAGEVVRDHVLRAADHGLAIDPGWFLSNEQIERIDKIVGPGSPTRIRELLDNLPRGTRYEDVQLVLKARKTRSTV